MSMLPIILAAAQNPYLQSCVFGGTTGATGTLNTNSWIQINLLVVLASFMISAVVYTVADIFPVSMREKMKGAARYEAFQGAIAIAIVIILVGIAATTCQIGSSLTASSAPVIHATYQDPIQYAQLYLGNLMFSKGLSLFQSIYSESILITIAGNIGDTVEEIVNTYAAAFLHVELGNSLFQIYYGFSGALVASFTPLIVVSFGVIFVVYLLLSLIQTTALTVVVPVAIIMRVIPFAGPKLRESSDTFLALALGFYFILPLAILFNAYAITWINTPCAAAGQVCNPYNQYTYPYALGTSPESNFFNSQPQSFNTGSGLLSGIPLTSSFLSGAYSSEGGLSQGITLMFQSLFDIPGVTIDFGIKTAEYLFEGIVMIGLDLAIVLAFAQGLTKGLNSVNRMMAVGPFWGNI